jgi:hypothetical protein
MLLKVIVVFTVIEIAPVANNGLTVSIDVHIIKIKS